MGFDHDERRAIPACRAALRSVVSRILGWSVTGLGAASCEQNTADLLPIPGRSNEYRSLCRNRVSVDRIISNLRNVEARAVEGVKRFRLAIAFVVATFAMSAVLYPMLPAMIPTHWSAAGRIDGWMPKLLGSLCAPLVSVVIVVCLIVFEPIRIREDTGGLDARQYPKVVAGVGGFIFIVNLWVLLAGLGWHLALP